MKSPKVLKTYNPGDVCFAKVRGFPHWPARIVALAEENTLKQFRYHVVFFGTGERALVKAEDMLDYFDNKNKFSKFMKRKQFQEGMEDIAVYINSSGLEAVEATDADLAEEGVLGADVPAAAVEESPAAAGKADVPAAESASEDDALVIDEAPLRNGAAGPKAAAAAANSRKRPATKGRKSDAAKEDGPAEKRQRRSVPAPAATPHPPEASPAVTSRSGRKIKPKKFSDDMDDTVEEAAAPTPTPTPTPTPRGRKSAAVAPPTPTATVKDSLDTDPELLELSSPHFTEDNANGMPILDYTDNLPGRVILVKTPNGQLCKLVIDANRPATFKDDTERRKWDETVARSTGQLKIDILEGEVTVDEYRAGVRRHIAADAGKRSRKDAEMLERKTGKLKLVNWLKIESRLVELDMLIKAKLGLTKTDVDACMPYLDELGGMVIDPLMLKKHPQVVETVKKLRRYVGNMDRWNFLEEEIIEFKSKANLIRRKADFIYNKMKGLFIVPHPESFWEVFSESVRVFQEKVKGLDLDLVYRIIEDPIDVISQELPTSDKAEPADAPANGEPAPQDAPANEPQPPEVSANGPLPMDSDSELENQPPAIDV